MAPRHQTEISADVAGPPEASGVINCRCERKRRELADTGDAHEAPASIGRSDHPPYVGVDRQNGGKHGGPGGNQTLHGSRQTRDAVARPGMPSLACSACLMKSELRARGS